MAERLSSQKIGFDVSGTLKLDHAGEKTELVFYGQRIDVEGPSILSIWRLLGNLRNLGEINTESGFVTLEPFEVRLKVRNEYVGTTSFSIGERVSTLARLRRFRPEIAPLARVLARDAIRYFKR